MYFQKWKIKEKHEFTTLGAKCTFFEENISTPPNLAAIVSMSIFIRFKTVFDQGQDWSEGVAAAFFSSCKSFPSYDVNSSYVDSGRKGRTYSPFF